jgi:hypothetical protein
MSAKGCVGWVAFPVDDDDRATSGGWLGWRPLTVSEEFRTGFWT